MGTVDTSSARPTPGSHSDSLEFTKYNDLACSKVGGGVVYVTDDSFGQAENLIESEDPVWSEDRFTEAGSKWIDGWQAKYSNQPTQNWCIIKLGLPGVIHGLDIDTAYFIGHHVSRLSIQAACLGPGELAVCSSRDVEEEMSKDELHQLEQSQSWEELLSPVDVQSGFPRTRHNYFPVTNKLKCTHLRINLLQGNGFARLRAFGTVLPDWASLDISNIIDLVAMENGGLLVSCSGTVCGKPQNLICPGESSGMRDGWEPSSLLNTEELDKQDQVHREESVEFRLGHTGIVTQVDVDTRHFKGNYPDCCYIEGCYCPDWIQGVAMDTHKHHWRLLLPVQKLSGNKLHMFNGNKVQPIGSINHVRLKISPDGAIGRLRLWGLRSQDALCKL